MKEFWAVFIVGTDEEVEDLAEHHSFTTLDSHGNPLSSKSDFFSPSSLSSSASSSPTNASRVKIVRDNNTGLFEKVPQVVSMDGTDANNSLLTGVQYFEHS